MRTKMVTMKEELAQGAAVVAAHAVGPAAALAEDAVEVLEKVMMEELHQ